ncbi:MAG TPA: hypothetical protein VL576_00430 [Candidatus Paceibacterota bacterium]|jgi:hypothetical protein|nr:hypothetical protein [Candidatus Paceibacterota bacterium]
MDVTWTTLEYEQPNRHRDWNYYAGLVAAIIAIIAFFYGNIFFGIFIIIAGVTVILYALRPPRHITITITADGVAINSELIPYGEIKQFWLDETEKPDKLLLLVKGAFMPMLVLPLQGVTAESVREALKPHSKEEEMRESRSVKLFDRLGF